MLKIIEVNVSDLKPAEYNPRALTKKEAQDLQNSLEIFGMVEPLVVNGAHNRFNIVIGGHQRLNIWRLKHNTIPVVYLDIPDLKKEQELNIRLNKNTGHWDLDMLANFEEELLKMSGFDNKEIDKLFDKKTTEDIAPEVEEKAVSKTGEIYKLGRHRLMCGDATNKANIDALLGGGKIDMVFTDPPYGNADSGKYGRGQLGIRTIAGDGDFSVFSKVIDLKLSDTYIFFLQWRTLKEAFESLEKNNLKLRTVGVWDKKNAGLNGGGGMGEQWEAIVFSGNFSYAKFGGNVFTESREHKTRIDSPHPHQKPIKLLTEILYFLDGRIILDPFGGSGSTLIACEQTSRTCYMMELDPKYCDVIRKRYAKHIGKEAEWENM